MPLLDDAPWPNAPILPLHQVSFIIHFNAKKVLRRVHQSCISSRPNPHRPRQAVGLDTVLHSGRPRANLRILDRCSLEVSSARHYSTVKGEEEEN